jgi:DNA-binding transcriptional LysR family regulator
VQLELEIANTAAIQGAVLQNQLDLGLIEGFVASDMLDVETLAADELIAIAAPGHPALQRAPLRAADLKELPVLMREQGSGSREVIEAALREREIALAPVMSLGSTEAIKNAVLHGLGVAIVSRLSVDSELQSRRLVELTFKDLRIRRDLYLVTLKGKRPSPSAAAFIALAQARQSGIQAAERGDVYAI